MLRQSELLSCCLDVRDAGPVTLERLAREYYEDNYAGLGAEPRLTHDGEPVLFLSDRVTHAFKDTPAALQTPRRRASSRPRWDAERVRRAPWIAPLIAGKIEGTRCWLLTRRAFGISADARLYAVRHWDLLRAYHYVVWLEPRGTGGLRFSSAYLAENHDLRRYTAEDTAYKIL